MTVPLSFVLVVLVNVGIAWLNCWAVGKGWRAARAYGDKLDRAALWCAGVQAAAGFSVPLVLFLTWLITAVMDNPSPATLKAIWEMVMSLWYVAVAVPVVGTGFVVWLWSLRTAWRQRDFASIATAGWNTYAQYRNTAGLFDGMGSAFDKIFDEDGGVVLLLGLLVVAASLCLSALLTLFLIRHYVAKEAEMWRMEIAR